MAEDIRFNFDEGLLWGRCGSSTVATLVKVLFLPVTTLNEVAEVVDAATAVYFVGSYLLMKRDLFATCDYI